MQKLIQTIGKSIFVTILCLMVSSVYADCSTAESDIAKLEQEIKDTDDRIAKGIFSVLPIGLALNAIQSSEDSEQEEMDAEEYEKQLEARIAEIKSECGLN